MSRKDYVAIAAILDSARSEYGSSPVLDDIVKELASLFARDNPAFDRSRFIEACGGSL
jgi:hypothetical protein